MPTFIFVNLIIQELRRIRCCVAPTFLQRFKLAWNAFFHAQFHFTTIHEISMRQAIQTVAKFQRAQFLGCKVDNIFPTPDGVPVAKYEFAAEKELEALVVRFQTERANNS